MRRSFNVRAFFIGFTSAFLCFCTVWMAAILFVRPQTSLSFSAVAPDSDASLYLPDASDCMTLLLCEDTSSPNLFFLLRFQPVSGEILIFSFPDTLVLTREQVSEPVRNIFSSFGIEGVQQGLQQTFDIPTHGYLMVKRDNLPLILDSIGSTQIELQEELSLVVDGIQLTLQQGLQLLDGTRMRAWLGDQLPAETLQQGEFLCQWLALCINQHIDLLMVENSQSLFSTAVNLTKNNLTFSDYDTRRQAANFLAELCPQPARVIPAEFTRNVDATLSLSADCQRELCDAFCE